MDFKENVKINLSAVEQVSSEFFSSYQRTVFGIVVYYCDECTLEIKKTYYDLFSDCTKHNSFFVIEALRFLHKQESYTKHGFSELFMWMDNSPNQFKTKEAFAFFCKLIVFYEYVEWNFFIEYHGKGPCDTRFSQISNMLKTHIMNTNNPLITNTQELVSAITYQQNEINEDRVRKEKQPEESYQLILTIDQMSKQKANLVISNFKFLHSFHILPSNNLAGFLLTGKQKFSQEWEIKFDLQERKNMALNGGKTVDNKKVSSQIWNSVSNKISKKDNFKKMSLKSQHKKTLQIIQSESESESDIGTELSMN